MSRGDYLGFHTIIPNVKILKKKRKNLIIGYILGVKGYWKYRFQKIKKEKTSES